MGTSLFIATSIGLFIAAQVQGQWAIQSHLLQDMALTSVVVVDHTIIVGTRTGIQRSKDKGANWQAAEAGLTSPYVRWLATSPGGDGLVLAGTEPAGIFRSTDGGQTWQSARAVAELRDRLDWFLPYSPEAGCVRGFGFTVDDKGQQRIYAAAEVGGLLVSKDGGRGWQLVAGSDGKPDMYRDLGHLIHPDVHSVAAHPQQTDLLTAATGGGLYRSTDAGRKWDRIHADYVRAVWVDPENSDHLVAGPSDGVSRNGRIEVSRDGGRTWQTDSAGLQAPWPRHMVERFRLVERNLFAVLSNGELWYRPLGTPVWRQLATGEARVKALAVGF